MSYFATIFEGFVPAVGVPVLWHKEPYIRDPLIYQKTGTVRMEKGVPASFSILFQMRFYLMAIGCPLP